MFKEQFGDLNFAFAFDNNSIIINNMLKKHTNTFLSNVKVEKGKIWKLNNSVYKY